MPLEQGGRVLLKIYSKDNELLVARPFTSQILAKAWYKERVKQEDETCELIPMVPRI